MARERRGPWGRLRLSTQILLLQLAIIVLTLGIGVTVSVLHARDELDRESGRQSLAIARTVAQMPEVRRAFAAKDPPATIQPIAEAVRHATGASFVVVANSKGIRYSHPDPAKIGQPLSTDPSQPLSGKEYVGVQTGSLGKSVRAKVPVRDARGRIIGLVSVGLLERNVTAQLVSDLPVLLIPPAIGLALGALGSFLVARRIKRQTFGLEPPEIATLLEQREAVLHGIREGVLATDTSGRITLANDEARRLLSLDAACVGRRIEEVIPPGPIREVLTGARPAAGEVVVFEGRILVIDRTAVRVREQGVGAVATLRDRTELDGALRELHTERSLAHALRTQAHEFYNKLHAVSGLIELGRLDEAVGLISRTALVHQELVDLIRERVGDPTLAALLLAKASVASDRGVDFRLASDTRLSADAADPHDLVSVVGNLVDNAMDAAVGVPGGWIEVAVADGPEGVAVRVRDSGPGVSAAHRDAIWREGFTTKRGIAHHGLGLALVRQITERSGGWVRISLDDPTEFTALLPARVAVAR
jgi:two-component system CitB family sensor kinase